MSQPTELDLEKILNGFDREERNLANLILMHGSIAGATDVELLTESTGLSYLVISDLIESLTKAGVASPTGYLNPSIAEDILNQMTDTEREGVTKALIQAYESIRPGEFIALAQLCNWLVTRDHEYASKTARNSIKAAEQYTTSFNWIGAIGMWLKAHECAASPEESLSCLWSAMELEWLLFRLDDLRQHAATMKSTVSETGLVRYGGLANWMTSRIDGRLNNFDEALDNIGKAEKCFRESEDQNTLALVLNTKGTLFNQMGRYDDATDIFNDLLEISQGLGNDKLRASVLGNLGYLQMLKKDTDNARRTLQSALDISDRSGLPNIKAPVLRHIALLEYNQKNYLISTELGLHSLEISSELGNWDDTIRSLTLLSAAFDKSGDRDTSEKYTREAHAQSFRTGSGDVLALTYNMFEINFRKQLDWLNKLLDAASRSSPQSGTYKAMRSELLSLLTEQMELANQLLDPDMPEEKKNALARLLETALERLNDA